MLIVHHLGTSQSERIVLLCEELGLPYDLKRYERDPITKLAPSEYKALHPLGAAPVITDDGHVMAESGAIVEYIVGRYGGGRLRIEPDDAEYQQYVYWYHFINGTLQAIMGRRMMLRRAGVDDGHPVMAAVTERLALALRLTNDRVGRSTYLAGDTFTGADVMIMFTLTTMRYFLPVDLKPYPGILEYIQRIAGRPAYVRAMSKCDPDMELLLS
jgi:glutathione S-transferase